MTGSSLFRTLSRIKEVESFMRYLSFYFYYNFCKSTDILTLKTCRVCTVKIC